MCTTGGGCARRLAQFSRSHRGHAWTAGCRCPAMRTAFPRGLDPMPICTGASSHETPRETRREKPAKGGQPGWRASVCFVPYLDAMRLYHHICSSIRMTRSGAEAPHDGGTGHVAVTRKNDPLVRKV